MFLKTDLTSYPYLDQSQSGQTQKREVEEIGAGGGQKAQRKEERKELWDGRREGWKKEERG